MSPKGVRVLALVVVFLGAGELLVYSAVLSSHRGGSWALPTFITVVALQASTVVVADLRARRRARRLPAPPVQDGR